MGFNWGALAAAWVSGGLYRLYVGIMGKRKWKLLLRVNIGIMEKNMETTI